ncbi:MerR-like DNA binding protein [Stackebrandtia albiflava]|uniref:MerR-like DNA binding protein n=1 Tax=Stackebrandtia albiflava TaxID=406432 RepID=A0A562VAL3_9ACTN|nr:MerR family transcriptional regulator [Stackebrandtia albiflava]TWJ14893.1 MerR-like DNA binding protein [Stackebrandtia albiflava]
MRIAELSRTSGVPVPSIKYYLRSGLLPPGERTAVNQADYTEAHVRRLRLIRALLDVGGLSIAAVGDVLTAIDKDDVDLNQALGTAIAAALPDRQSADSPDVEAAHERVSRLTEERGWLVSADSHKMVALTQAVAALYRLGADDVDRLLAFYVETVEPLARREAEWAIARGDKDQAVEGAIVGTFIGAAVINALRIIVHEDTSLRRFGRTKRDD